MIDRLKLIKVRFEERHKFGSNWAESADDDIAWLIDAALVGQRLLGSVAHLRDEVQRLRATLEMVACQADAEAKRFDPSSNDSEAHEVKSAAAIALGRVASQARAAACASDQSPQPGGIQR
jgi:hypothetical protein